MNSKILAFLAASVMVAVACAAFAPALSSGDAMPPEEYTFTAEREGDFGFKLDVPESVPMFKVDGTYNPDVVGFKGMKITILDPTGKDRMTYDKEDPAYRPYSSGFPGDSIYFDWIHPKDANDNPVDSFKVNVFYLNLNESAYNKTPVAIVTINVLDPEEYHAGTIVSEISGLEYGKEYSGSVKAGYVDNQASYKVVGGELPTGMILNNDGSLTGTPMFAGEGDIVAGKYTITVEVSHDCGRETGTDVRLFTSDVIIHVAAPEVTEPDTPADPEPETPAPETPSYPEPPMGPIADAVVIPTNGCIVKPL